MRALIEAAPLRRRDRVDLAPRRPRRLAPPADAVAGAGVRGAARRRAVDRGRGRRSSSSPSRRTGRATSPRSSCWRSSRRRSCSWRRSAARCASATPVVGRWPAAVALASSGTSPGSVVLTARRPVTGRARRWPPRRPLAMLGDRRRSEPCSSGRATGSSGCSIIVGRRRHAHPVAGHLARLRGRVDGGRCRPVRRAIAPAGPEGWRDGSDRGGSSRRPASWRSRSPAWLRRRRLAASRCPPRARRAAHRRATPGGAGHRVRARRRCPPPPAPGIVIAFDNTDPGVPHALALFADPARDDQARPSAPILVGRGSRALRDRAASSSAATGSAASSTRS